MFTIDIAVTIQEESSSDTGESVGYVRADGAPAPIGHAVEQVATSRTGVLTGEGVGREHRALAASHARRRLGKP